MATTSGSMLINQGDALVRRQQMRPPRTYREEHGLNEPLLVQYFNWITGIFPWAISATPTSTTSRSPRWFGERLPRNAGPGAHLPHPRVGHRHRLRHPRRHPAIFLGRHAAFASSFLGMTVPRFLLALIITLHPGLQAERAGDRQLLFVAIRRRALSWAKFVDLVKHVWPVIASPPSAGSPTTCA